MGGRGRLRRHWAVVAAVCVVAVVVAVPGSTAIAHSQRFPDVPRTTTPSRPWSGPLGPG